LHETRQELGVHAVDAKDDELLPSLPMRSASLARGQYGNRGKQEKASEQPNDLSQMLTPSH